MSCYDEFPLLTVLYNWATVGGLITLGIAAAAQFGAVVVVGYAVLALLAMVGTIATICTRCAGYYGRRCGLGLGGIVSSLFEQRRSDLYLRTPLQLLCLILFLGAVAWPIVGGGVLLAREFSPWRLARLVAAVALLMAFAVPHRRMVCSHCRQGASGDCPVGKSLWNDLD